MRVDSVGPCAWAITLLGRAAVSRWRGHSPCLLDALRRATRTAHDRLEARLPIGRSDPSMASYRAIVAAFHGFYEPLETRLGNVAPLLAPLPWEPRRKMHLLRADLLALGATAEGVDGLPRCERLPTVSDAPDALGCLYVVEGATLGGRVISRRLQPLGISPESGGRFFHGYGERTGPMWAEFVDRLHAGAGDRREEDRTVEAAVAVFEALETWLDARGVLQ